MDKLIIIFLVIKNEGEYLNEWLQYHIGMGVDKFIIIDDMSSDETFKVLQPYIKLNYIHYFKEKILFPTCKEHRLKYYNLLKNVYNNSLLIFIDIDEFLYIKGNNLKILNNLNIKSCYITETRLIRKTKKTSFNILNEEIYFINYSNRKAIIKIDKDKIPICENSHCVYFDKKNFKKLRLDIGYFHIKWLSFEEEKQKLIKYNSEKCNSYYKTFENLKNTYEKFYNNSSKKYHKINIYSKKIFKLFFNKNGFLIINNFFDKKIVNSIYRDACDIYKTQMIKLNIIKTKKISNYNFENAVKILFKNNFKTFISCGKQCQHLISLWKLSIDDKLIKYLKMFGIKNPIISTRPVLFSNSKHIAKNSINHTVPPHQDWASMQGSINSIVIWIPLIDVNQDLGSIALVPKSHKEGLLSKKKIGSFGMVNKYKKEDFVSFDVKQGDIILFNSFLVHQSGNNITDNIRWSCHMRYNDLNENSFIERGYPHAYIYKPIDQYLTPNFDTKTEINKYLTNQ